MKGKNCNLCKESRLKRFYIRSYYEGYSFKVNPIGAMVGKGKFEPVGWVCEKCGNIQFDENQFWTNRAIKQRKRDNREMIYDLWVYALRLRANIKINKVYKYTEESIELRKAVFMHRFYRFKADYGTREFLKGLKQGHKDSDKHWKQRLEDEKLTDEQILNKAEIIKTRRKLGFK